MDMKWTPVAEALPENECKYICTIKNKIGTYVDISYYTKWLGFGRSDVIAWMPAPEPYREEE